MNQNSTTTEINKDNVHRSKPIPISTEHLRHRSTSFSSDISNSPTSTSSPPPFTPKNFPTTSIPISSSSPILHYLSQAPTKPPATFPFRGFAPSPVFEDEPAEESKPTHHARRASTAGRFQLPPPAPEPRHGRGVNVLRRLSLSQGPKSAAADIPARQPGHPSPPSNSATSGSFVAHDFLSDRKPRRSATVSGSTDPRRRAPSPMGERILKGHFDGFN